MMAADYRHIGGLENRLGRHYSRFRRFSPRHPLPINHLSCENSEMQGRIGEVRLAPAQTPLLAPVLTSPTVGARPELLIVKSVSSLNTVSTCCLHSRATGKATYRQC